jgi:hypothetical protein
MNMRGPIIAITLLLAAQAHAGGVAYIGPGAGTCAEFAANPREESFYYTWAQGFLGGRNADRELHKEETINLAVMSPAEQKRFLRNYCDQHSLAEYTSAVVNLEAALAAKWGQTSSDQWHIK